MTPVPQFVPLVEATRGDLVESTHFGAIAVVDTKGQLIASCGDPHQVAFLRSSSKPFQALPFIEQGGAEAFHLTNEEIAVLCSSHIGTDHHVEVVAAIQTKTGIKQEDLLCGTHPPYDKSTSEAMLLRGEKPSPNRHNCSGKHTGFLALALLNNLEKADYINPQHPLQVEVTRTFAELCHIDVKDVHIGIDGCSAPVFGIPLVNAAWGWANLCDPTQLPASRAAACRKITNAMTSFPEMIAGFGSSDTRIMQVGAGKIVVKRGAEGYQSIGLLPGAFEPESPALGIVFKIADGDPLERARPLVGIEILRQLGALSAGQIQALSEFYTRPIYNWSKLVAGELRPAFQLNWA